ncbi:MAG: hydroxyacylglutathione hydrolase [Motiliproteus sp.]
MFTVTPIPAFQDNYIWMLKKPNSTEVFVVDPGDAAAVIATLQQQRLSLAGILITHHHADHTGGALQLSEAFQAPIYGPANSPFKGISRPLNDGDSCLVLGETLQVKRVPGHTLDHISYFLPGEVPQLFCGDTLFLAGCGRLFEGTPSQLLTAMRYFSRLPDVTEVYCTHEYSMANLAFAAAVEPQNIDIQQSIRQCQLKRDADQPTVPSNIAKERLINPFMRTATDSVRTAASQQQGAEVGDEEAVMSVIREWKNNF